MSQEISVRGTEGKAFMSVTNAFLSLLIVFGVLSTRADAQLLSRDNLIDDARELAGTIESVHPDPYSHGGGKIAFHRLFQHTLGAIPDSGMTKDEFFDLLEPFVASVGDAHTAVSDPHLNDPYSPGGLPLYFETADNGLYVAAVLRQDHRSLLGALLTSIEGVSFRVIVQRYRQRRGADNDYLLYRILGGQGTLWNAHSLRKLIPEWVRMDSIRVGLCLPSGTNTALVLAIPDHIDFASFISPQTTDMALVGDYMQRLQRTDIFYSFLDSTQQTCWLVIRDLSSYREAFETWQSYGIKGRDNQARAVYQRYHGAQPPADIREVIAGLPSATELFRSMVQDMKKPGTKNLLIDLSQNGGGNSLLSNILLYFLYGKEVVLSVKGRTTEIVKYSPEYFAKFPSPTLEEINLDRPVALTVDGYDFTADYGHLGYPGLQHVTQEFEKMLGRMPTFQTEYESGRYSGYYLPENVLVLCDAGTFSSAFFVMYYLKQAGAEIVGIPSAQAGNCFGDIIQSELPNSGLKFQVSRKYFELFPNDPERGRVLVPDHLMTYDVMASYDFDPAALIWFALDLLKRRDTAGN